MDIHQFTAGQAVRFTGATYRQLDHWARTGFLVPSITQASGTGTDRAYSFGDLVALRTAVRLRDAGLSLQQLRKVVACVQQVTGAASTTAVLAGQLILWDGREAYLRHADELVALLRNPGQTVFAFVLDLSAVGREVEQRVEEQADRRVGRVAA